MAVTLLSLRDVCKFYGQKLIFNNLNLEIPAGAGILITGENGAGKSTLLRIMAGLSLPSGGAIAYPENTSPAYLGHAAFIYPQMTALENLRFWANAHNLKNTNEEINAVLKKVNLLSYAREKAGSFSRGMAQRLNFSRVLLFNPQLFLLDEPFSGMDVQSRETLFDELLNRKKQGAAIVMVSHALEKDAAIADQAFAIKKHKLIPVR